MDSRFSVSVKGVLESGGKLLLRKNERGEFELLGGRLEKGDASIEHRLRVEFLEESGIDVEVLAAREPWLYQVGAKNIIILPFVCSPLNIPPKLEDQDGGTLHWVAPGRPLPMPRGYRDTLSGLIPHTSSSSPAKSFLKTIPNYVEDEYFIEIYVRQGKTILLREYLTAPCSPREFIDTNLGEKYPNDRLAFQSSAINARRDTVTLNYAL